MSAQRRYWDANAFIGWLANETGNAEKCEGVLTAAEDGTVQIVTSALTLTEVIKLKRKTPLPPESAQKIKDFFEHDYIVVRQVDRFIAEQARDLIWQQGVEPKDAIHLATALSLNLQFLDTFDNELIALTGKLGTPKLIIGHPNVPHQLGFDYGAEHKRPPRRGRPAKKR